jgi:hypothetical protein
MRAGGCLTCRTTASLSHIPGPAIKHVVEDMVTSFFACTVVLRASCTNIKNNARYD